MMLHCRKSHEVGHTDHRRTKLILRRVWNVYLENCWSYSRISNCCVSLCTEYIMKPGIVLSNLTFLDLSLNDLFVGLLFQRLGKNTDSFLVCMKLMLLTIDYNATIFWVERNYWKRRKDKRILVNTILSVFEMNYTEAMTWLIRFVPNGSVRLVRDMK